MFVAVYDVIYLRYLISNI